MYSTFIGGSDFDSFSGDRPRPGGQRLADRRHRARPTSRSRPARPTPRSTVAATPSSPSSTPPARRCCSRPSSAARRREGGADIARDANGDIYVTGITFSQDFPATVGAFDRVWNGDLQIFWGDAFVTKIDIDASTSTPPAPPGVPGAPTLVSPSNGSTQPQPITFDWNDAAERGLVHDPDRRLERVQRTAGA